MDYTEFLEQVRSSVQLRAGEEVRVTITRILKNNRDIVDTITIMSKGENAAPAIYMDQFYQSFCQGSSLEDIVECIIRFYRMSGKGGNVDLSFYTDFSRVKNKIACKLVNYEKNEYMLDHVPHRKYLDLAIVYYCRMDHELIGKGSILIHHTHLELWNISEEELYEIAVRNTFRMLPYEFVDIADMLEEMTGLSIDEEEHAQLPIYVLTNTEKYYGAVNIIYESILEAIGDNLQQDYFIMPSSIHECMIIPALDGISEEDLQVMVHEINEEHVAPEEILGESIYRYDRRTKLLYITAEKNKCSDIYRHSKHLFM